MEKLVSSNIDEERKKEREKYNQTSIFLTRFLFGANFDLLRKMGYKDAYTSDPEVMSILTLDPKQRFVFLLFKNKKLNAENIRKIINELAQVPVEVVFSYELVNDYSMVVIDFPEKFIPDYDNVVEGKYSKLTDSFKDRFPMVADRLNSKNQVIGKEYTLYYHIFNKTQWLKDLWMEKLGLIDIEPTLELWEKPKQTDLVFDLKTII